MKIVALIPARGGSKRIPRKNLERIGGVTLVELAIRCTTGSKRVSATFVSTDDSEISRLALRAGAYVTVRPPALARDDTTTDEVISDWLKHLELIAPLGGDDIIVIVEPTAPLRTSADLDLVVDLMISTGAPGARMVHVDPLGCHGEVYRDVGLAQAIRVGSFSGCLFPEGTLLVHAGDKRGMGIDTMEDLEQMRRLAAV